MWPTSGSTGPRKAATRRPSRSRRSSPRASRSWCRWSRTRSAPRARGSRRRSRSPGGCWSTCRRTRTSASRSASRTKPARSALREQLQQLHAARREGRLHRAHRRRNGRAPRSSRADIDYLRRLWRDVRERALGAAARRSWSTRTCRSPSACCATWSPTDTARVMIDSRENFQKLAAFAETYMPEVRAKLEHYTGERPLFDLYDVEDEIEQALARRVELKSGGYLIIDQTEAMTTIDVNTGGFVGTRNLDDTDLQDQPRGGAGDRAPAAPAQPRRHHHHRLHRHGHRGAPRRGAATSWRSALARDHAHDGQRLHRAGPGGDDAQAHARVARPRAVRALPGLRRARRGEDRAHRVLRDPPRDPARGARLQRARVPRARRAAR